MNAQRDVLPETGTTTVSEALIHLTIDGKRAVVPPNTTVLAAAASLDIDIPSLCFLEETGVIGSCRLCAVEIRLDGTSRRKIACGTVCEEGMEIITETAELSEYRRALLDKLLSRHFQSCFNCSNHEGCAKRGSPLCYYDENCFTCGKRDECSLRKYSLRYGLYRSGEPLDGWLLPAVETKGSIRFNKNRCLMCRRCERACADSTGSGRICFLRGASGMEMLIEPGDGCGTCGKCASVCPTGAVSIIKNQNPV